MMTGAALWRNWRSFGDIKLLLRKRKVTREQKELESDLQRLNYQPGNYNWRERLTTIDLLIKMFCFVKNASVLRAADLNQLLQGGQSYWSFPFG